MYGLFCVPVPLADLPPVDQERVPPCTRDTPGYHGLKRIDRIEPGVDIHVLGDHPQSLDSRIFGPISREDIVGVALMVWVLRGGEETIQFPAFYASGSLSQVGSV